MEAVNQALSDMNDDLVALTTAAEDITIELNEAGARGTTAKAMLTIMTRLAGKWNPIADRLGEHVASYSVGMDAIAAREQAR